MPATSELIANIVATANGIGFPPAVAFEQLKHESGNFRPDVLYGPFIGRAGERGLAQFIPGTWARFGSGDPYNPANSLAAWANYTSYLLEMFHGDIAKVLMAYNGGEGNVQRNTVSNAARNYATRILSNAQNTDPNSVSTSQNLDPIFQESNPSVFPSLFGLSPFYSALAFLGVVLLAVNILPDRD